jgi:hypothetical protein
MRNRGHRIEFILDDHDFAKLSRAVKKSGLSYAKYLRSLVRGYVPQDRPCADYRELLKELRAIGRNINQIAYVANATGHIDGEKYAVRYFELTDAVMRIQVAAEAPRPM